MRLGMVGLGKMGANMARRLMRGGHEIVVTDLNPENVKNMAAEGALHPRRSTTSSASWVSNASRG